MKKHHILGGLAVVVTLAVGTNGLLSSPAGATSTRNQEVVTVSPANTPNLVGLMPNQVVAFSYGNNAWQQQRVQVDERDTKNLAVIMNRASDPALNFLVYTDPNTFTGPDSNTTVDNNDEIVFVSSDAAESATSGVVDPTGVIAGTRTEVKVVDPLNPTADKYMYLFKSDGTLGNLPAGQQPYVTYNFVLNSGNYKTTYKTSKGPNPENSTASTANYSVHFTDRWIKDKMQIKAGGANNADILDQDKFQFGPNECLRTVSTFSSGEGAFIVNKSGPVRGLRSYLGANSGDYTQRTHYFNPDSELVTDDLRVHPIAAAGAFIDHSPAAVGMTFFNSNNTSGVPLDGNPDSLNTGAATWAAATGAQGSYTVTYIRETNIPNPPAEFFYYLDQKTRPGDKQCTGDASAYGNSGDWTSSQIACTDPRGITKCPTATFYTFQLKRYFNYSAPGLTAADAAQKDQFVRNPLQVVVN